MLEEILRSAWERARRDNVMRGRSSFEGEKLMDVIGGKNESGAERMKGRIEEECGLDGLEEGRRLKYGLRT